MNPGTLVRINDTCFIPEWIGIEGLTLEKPFWVHGIGRAIRVQSSDRDRVVLLTSVNVLPTKGNAQ